MTSFLEMALSCIRRGWYVFPCWPKTKKPMTNNGFYAATLGEDQARAWWTATPDANVAIATGPSKLTVWDFDHGFNSGRDFTAFALRHRIPPTYGVRSGRRDSFGMQLYFTGEQVRSVPWEFDGCSGDIRSETGYVMAESSVHPDTGERYELLWDFAIAPFPDALRALKKATLFDLEGSGELDKLRIALEAHGISYEDKGDKLYVPCPWAHEHSAYSGPSEAALFVKRGIYCFKCHHSSCDGRSYSQYRIEAIK